jgi:hypothetical protein
MTNGTGWLAVSPTSGTLAAGAQATLTVTITSSGLASGSYSGNVAISAAGTPAGNSPQNTSVSLTVTPAPTISLTAGTMTFTGTRWTTCNAVASGTAVANQTFTVSNTGDAALNYAAAASTTTGGSWLSVSPTSGAVGAAGSATLTVSVNLAPGGAALAQGSYSGSITVTDANATNSPQTKAVTLTVGAAGAKLCVAPTSRALGTIVKGSATTTTFSVQNVGDSGSIAWTAGTPTAVTRHTISRTPASGTATTTTPSTITFSVTPASNATSGTNASSTFTVSATGQTTLTQTVSWTVQ